MLRSSHSKVPFYISFEEAWNSHDLVNFFFSTGETKEDIHQLFRQGRFSLSSKAANQPPYPAPTPRLKWYRNSISREKLAEFNQFVQTFPAIMTFHEAWRHYPFTPILPQLQRDSIRDYTAL
ncbi:unnamed protein product [Microthlaspi erraticum]|uniref:Uncharacterized protein n=1 Tax=Microthlaspi erraticum TaxID=1685480 RepID=A0A6D2J2J8_9BRAS|nr:unnamed protein product [Microthlaspi erraticum]